jgi:hypothetical protein
MSKTNKGIGAGVYKLTQEEDKASDLGFHQ